MRLHECSKYTELCVAIQMLERHLNVAISKDGVSEYINVAEISENVEDIKKYLNMISKDVILNLQLVRRYARAIQSLTTDLIDQYIGFNN